MQFKVGDYVIRKKEYRNSYWRSTTNNNIDKAYKIRKITITSIYLKSLKNAFSPRRFKLDHFQKHIDKIKNGFTPISKKGSKRSISS